MKNRRHRDILVQRTSAFACAMLVFVLLPLRVQAHADLLGMIAVLNEQMRTNGVNAERLLARADLYRAHQDWAAALQDYDAVAEDLTNSLAVAHGRALALAGSGKLSEARGVFDQALRQFPTNAPLRLGRARVLAELNEPALAIADYTSALANAKNPTPQDYLERAKLQADTVGPAAAVKGLDEGLARLGWTLTLQRLAVDYALASGDTDGALARLETIHERANRKENWLALKGDILQQAGRKADALAAYEAALKAIGELPPRLVRAGVVAALQTRVEAAVAALKQEGRTHQADR